MSALDLIVHALSRRVARPLFRPMMRRRATIFMLHRVTDTALGVSGHTLEFVQAAIRALRESGAQFVSVRQIIDACVNGTEPGDDWVAWTIDDGFADQAVMAREVFVAESCPATVFLISGLMDGQLWPWDDRLAYAFTRAQAARLEITLGGERCSLPLCSPQERSAALAHVRGRCKRIPNKDLYAIVDMVAHQMGVSLPDTPPPAYRPLTWDEARALESAGVEFAPHSITHRIFSQLSADEAREEIQHSWRRMQEELTHPVPLFAWPTGRRADYTSRDVELVREAGLEACASTEPDYTPLDLRSSAVHGLCSLRRFPLPSRIRDVLQYGSWIERGKQLVRGALPGR